MAHWKRRRKMTLWKKRSQVSKEEMKAYEGGASRAHRSGVP